MECKLVMTNGPVSMCDTCDQPEYRPASELNRVECNGELIMLCTPCLDKEIESVTVIQLSTRRSLSVRVIVLRSVRKLRRYMVKRELTSLHGRVREMAHRARLVGRPFNWE